MARLSEIPRPRKILLTGEPKVGKTTILGNFCQLFGDKALYVSTDVSGPNTLSGMGLDPETVPINSWEDMPKALSQIAKAMQSRSVLLVDDLTHFQEQDKLDITFDPQDYAERDILKTSGKEALEASIGRKVLVDGRKWEQGMWGELDLSFSYTIHELQHIPQARIIVMTTLLREARHTRSNEIVLFPNLDGSIRNELLARFDMVVHLFRHTSEQDSKDYHCMTTRGKGNHQIAGDRFNPGERARTWVNMERQNAAVKLLSHALNARVDVGFDAVLDVLLADSQHKYASQPETALEKAIGVGVIATPEQGQPRQARRTTTARK